jgi:hypothetical protein
VRAVSVDFVVFAVKTLVVVAVVLFLAILPSLIELLVSP